MYKFNVFGSEMSVFRKENEWQLFKESTTGIRARVYDVVIPQSLEPGEIAQYLDDIFHEMASKKHPTVERLS
ncbi:hypothetical protein PA25_37520 [Pseudoalteromonas sp. A25]|uniref:DUF7661 family protein n=1 Tax=Pseudoalteromonas sp. A25 TaxID=116092 RepID=UPI001260D222|nr:hypothetical protein [Pseudoalteromonas sp. A25]BBN83767.1 hypothetical protein PA25_37520 [Pseudoalteromonas sp. A25]